MLKPTMNSRLLAALAAVAFSLSWNGAAAASTGVFNAGTRLAEIFGSISVGQACNCETPLPTACQCDVVKINPPDFELQLIVGGAQQPLGGPPPEVGVGEQVEWFIVEWEDFDKPCVCCGCGQESEELECPDYPCGPMRSIVQNMDTGEIMLDSLTQSSVTPTECGHYEVTVIQDSCVCDSGSATAEFDVVGDAELGECAQSGDCVPVIDIVDSDPSGPLSLVTCLPPDNHSSVQLVLSVPPSGGATEWSLVGETHGATINPLTGLLVAGHEEGWITIRVCYGGETPPDCCIDPENPGEKLCCEEISILLRNCDEGGDCESCDSGDCAAGGGRVSVGSVDVFLDLGKSPEGKSAGYLAIHELAISAELASPSVLKLVRGEGTGFIAGQDNPLSPPYFKQVRSPEVLADIVDGESTSYDWKIEFYDESQVIEEFGPTGEYGHTGSPFNTWEFDYIDASTFRIKKKTPGLPDVTYEYMTGANPEDMRLTVTDMNGVLRDEEILWFGDEVRRFKYRDSLGAVILTVAEELATSGDTQRIISRTVDPDGLMLLTEFEYYADTAPAGKAGRLKSVTDPNGSWEWMDYDDQSRQTLVVRPWLDSTLSGSGDPNPNEHRTTAYSYAALQVGDGLDPREPRTTTESILGTVVGKSFHAYLELAEEETTWRLEIEERCVNPAATFGDSTNLRTETTFVDLTDENIASIKFPDGRLDTYAYQTVYTSDFSSQLFGYPNEPTFNLNPNPEDVNEAAFERVTITHTDSTGSVVALKTTQDVLVRDAFGRVYFEKTLVFDGSSYVPLEYTVRMRDDHGHEVQSWRSDGTQTSTGWSCCLKQYDIDATGIQTGYEYDGLGRLTKERKLGVGPFSSYPAQSTLETIYALDTLGRVTGTTVQDEGNPPLALENSRTFDAAGRVATETDPANLITNYEYATTAGGGRQVTVNLPGNVLTRITDYHRDGRVAKVTGTAQVAEHYTYGVNTDGTQWTKVRRGSPLSGGWVKTTFDLLGRKTKEERPGKDGDDTLYTYFTYNDAGQLIRRWSNVVVVDQPRGGGPPQWSLEPGKADTLYVYDTLGELIRTCIDIDRDGVVDLAGPDQVTDTDTSYAHLNGEWWQQTTTSIYPEAASADPVVVGKERRQITGLGNPLDQPPVGGPIVTAFGESEDIHGNVTSSQTAIDWYLTILIESVTSPDSTQPQQTISYNGLLQSTTTQTGLTYAYAYDGLGRRTETTDPRTGASLVEYNDLGQVASITDAAGKSTTFTYAAATGRRVAVADHDGKVTRYQYNDAAGFGQLRRIWGDVPQPVEFEYDATYAYLKKMRTYRTEENPSVWTDLNWPHPTPGTADETQWFRNQLHGQLVAKHYADNSQVTYEYNTHLELEKRKWARGGGTVVTTYGYDEDTGQLTTINYSDATPDAAFTYNRLGQIKTVADAVGTRTLHYQNLQLWTEDIDAGASGLYDKVLNWVYDDGSGGVPGRQVGFGVGVENNELWIGYGYDAFGRLNSVANLLGPEVSEMLPAGGVEYSYLTNSDLVERLEYKDGSAATIAESIRAYEPDRDLLASVENKGSIGVPPVNVTVSKYAYQNDNLARRTSVVRTGSAFAPPMSNGDHFDLYGYNGRNELTGSTGYFGTDPGQTGNPMLSMGRDLDYSYDPIGNRINSGIDAGAPTAYTANNLNQYTATASPAESFTYDLDGNLTQDGDFVYKYDAENRLKAVAQDLWPNHNILEVAYDYRGRRVRKVEFWPYQSQYQGAKKDVRFVYDGWNVVLELDGLNTGGTGVPPVIRKYAWGLDLSGTLQGAGGIGGLLAMEDTKGTVSTSDDEHYLYFYDANGNVGQLIDWSTTPGTIAAHYEYGPYGGLLAGAGSYWQSNPYRFSTKYFDAEFDYAGTSNDGLYYYGSRFYSPRLGRWLNRDPIEELGGTNLYVHTSNAPVIHVDPLGEACGPYLDKGITKESKAITQSAVIRVGAQSGKLVVKNYEVDFQILVSRKVFLKLVGTPDGVAEETDIFLFEQQLWRWPRLQEIVHGNRDDWGKLIALTGAGCRKLERCMRVCERTCCSGRGTPQSPYKFWTETKKLAGQERWVYGTLKLAGFSYFYYCELLPDNALFKVGTKVYKNSAALNCNQASVTQKCSDQD